MGERGQITRLLAAKYGGFLTFAALSPDKASAPGQPTIQQLQVRAHKERVYICTHTDSGTRTGHAHVQAHAHTCARASMQARTRHTHTLTLVSDNYVNPRHGSLQ